ncbi:phage tail protein, partial [Achromobacter sp. Marseille-Q0513]|nr:phage tail protein [Achromobacter sp. Marseille-Q0513]
LQQLRNQLFGIGQALRPRTTSLLAWYKNTTNRPIMVGAMFRTNVAGTTVLAGYLNTVASTTGMTVHSYLTIPGLVNPLANSISMMVPPGLYWTVDASNASVVESWEYS